VFTCVNIPPILELKVILPQQNSPVQPSAITKDVTCIGEDVGGGDDEGEGVDEDVGGGDAVDGDDKGGDADMLFGEFLVKSR